MWLFRYDRETMVSVYVEVVSRILKKGRCHCSCMSGLPCGFNTWYGGGDGRGTCMKHKSPDIMNSSGKTKIMS